MICQNCLKNAATVHVTEIVHETVLESTPAVAPSKEGTITEQHLCDVCAQSMDLPHSAATKKSQADIWKLLQLSKTTQRKSGATCPSCGMTLDEFRKKGRLGCAKDYEVFAAHIGDLLERVHGARTHVGRIPGSSEAELDRMKRLVELRSRLDVAIREEAYESAARLRDELKALEEPRPST
ncbi:MAG: UvrB/UvrC motif-containing protein [Planctomycetota bacterium]|nr:UvrB/UvrC motif-containing protein [Planctomycetota bacterium]